MAEAEVGDVSRDRNTILLDEIEGSMVVIANDGNQGQTATETSLQQAVRDGSDGRFDECLKRAQRSRRLKSEINAKDCYGIAAVHYAARFNRVHMMQKLLENGADPKAFTEDHLTPLHYAARYIPIQLNEEVSRQRTFTEVLRSSSGKMMDLLISKNVDINPKDDDGHTPLHLACMRGNYAAVEILIRQERIEVNSLNKRGDTPLHFACLIGNEKIVKLLMENEADCHIANHEKQIPLHVASAQCHDEVVKAILFFCSERKCELINALDIKNNTPLHLACESGSLKVVVSLLRNEADPNSPRLHNVTPLHIVAKEGFIDIAGVLLNSSNSKIDVRDSNLLSPLHYAARFNRHEFIKFLLQQSISTNNKLNLEVMDKDSCTPLLTAVYHGQSESMNVLIEAGAFQYDLDKDGKSAVYIAAEKGRHKILESVLKSDWGKDLINTADSSYNTPLHIACKNGHLNCIKVLLNYEELKINPRNDADKTPLHLAASAGHSKIVIELTKFAQYNNMIVLLKDVDDDGNTALHLSSTEGRFSTTKALIAAGTDPNIRNARNWTPIICAAASGHEKIVRILIEAKSNINHTDINNCTALHVACKEGHLQVVSLLLHHKADASICSSDGLNPLDVAVECGQKDVAMVIVTSSQWVSALRNVTYFTIQSVEEFENEELDETATWLPFRKKKRLNEQRMFFTTPMRRIIKKMPDVAEAVFDRCCMTNRDKVSPEHTDYKIVLNYEFLEDFRMRKLNPNKKKKSMTNVKNTLTKRNTLRGQNKKVAEEEEEGFETAWGPLEYSKQCHCLNILANSKSVHLLKHPLASTLLNHKWLKYGQILYYINLFLYFLFVLLLTSFALSVPSPNSALCVEVFKLDNDISNATAIDCFPEGRVVPQRYVSFAGICVVIYSVAMLIREVVQLIKFKLHYLKGYINYIEILMFILSIAFASLRLNQCYCTRSWQWQVGVVALFLSWIILIYSIRKIPIAGIYVVMFISIFFNFIKVLILALLLILAFAFSFYMIFYDPEHASDGRRTPFETPWRTIIKTMTMTTGEYELDATLRQTGEVNTPDLQYPVVTFSLLIVFLILMPILLINLLVGLAVDDIKGMQDSADTTRLALRVELALTVEQYLPYSWRKRLIIGDQTMYPNKKQSLWRRFFIAITGSETPKSIKHSLQAPQAPVLEVRRQNVLLAQQVHELQSSMDYLLYIVKKMNDDKFVQTSASIRGHQLSTVS